jgi:hypothetical protein
MGLDRPSTPPRHGAVGGGLGGVLRFDPSHGTCREFSNLEEEEEEEEEDEEDEEEEEEEEGVKGIEEGVDGVGKNGGRAARRGGRKAMNGDVCSWRAGKGCAWVRKSACRMDY